MCPPEWVVFRELAVTEEDPKRSGTLKTVEQGGIYGVGTAGTQFPQQPYEPDRVALADVCDGIAGEQGSDLGVRAPTVTRASVPAQDPDVRTRNGRMRTSGGWSLIPRPARVAVTGALAQDRAQVLLAGDQHPARALTADTGDPPTSDRIRPRRPDSRPDGTRERPRVDDVRRASWWSS